MRSYGIKDMGNVRTENQDNYYCQDNSVGMFQNLYIVADGMGGHKGGAFASTFVVNKLVENAEKSNGWDIVAFFNNVLKQLNQQMIEMGKEKPEYSGMGTTLVAATEKDGKLYGINVGDSRLYLMHQGRLRQVTTDHSYVQELVSAGLLLPEEARNHPKRNMITRAVGAPQRLEVDHFIVPLEAGDQILLCSDGLHGMVEDKKIEEIMNESTVTLERKSKMLVLEALGNGGKDNIAVVLALYEGRGDQAC